jgi:curved DNA-binding protein CbpA
MPPLRFRGNPYHVLDVRSDASNATIKRRWRELAREHHPDRAAGDGEEAARLTARMAQINAAYDLLRDPVRRETFDVSAEGRRARESDAGAAGGGSASFDEDIDGPRPTGPPPPPRTPPVTARFDTSSSFRPRNARLEDREAARTLRGQPPVSRRAFEEERDLRASTPTGPVERRRGARPERLPTVAEALETPLEFGRYHGYTLGEVEMLEPAYLDWIAQTITRDRELVTKARVIQGDRNRHDLARKKRSAAPRFGAAAG